MEISAKKTQGLPAREIAELVSQTVSKHANVVITAPPGAGKSTLLPLTLLQGFHENGKILMLEPRRMAARQIAERMADLLDEPVGKTVGYRIRFESRVSAQTRIEVLTEGILTRMLTEDPTLEGVSAVIFDEFHERSLNSDVALAQTRQAQELIRPDLKIILMSATIQADTLCAALHAPLVESEGKMFPVEIIHANEDASALDCAERVAQMVKKAHAAHEGDILAFLPGEAEIRKCAAFIGDALGTTSVLPLYGMLDMREQQKAIAPSLPGERKVVLATPIAETSLTIQGVRVVIDAGFYRKMRFNAQSSLSHLETERISQDMATQRAGRAGRMAPGTCYRLYTLATVHRMEENRKPEILEADLTPMMLDLAAWGDCQVEHLSWLTLPPVAQVAKAKELLQLLGAVTENGTLTSHGKALAALPCHPRIAQMLTCAPSAEEKALSADLAALLDGRDPWADLMDTADITERVERLREARRNGKKGFLTRIMQTAEQYRRLVHVPETNSITDSCACGKLIALAFPERVARLADKATCRYQLASGEQAVLAHQDPLSAQEWLAVANLHMNRGEGRIHLAAPVEPQALAPMLTDYTHVSWDSRQGCVVAQTERRLGRLIIQTKPLLAENLQEQVHQAICQAVRKEGLSMLDFSENVQQLQRRIATVAEWHPELELPDLSTPALLEKASEWLPYYIGKAQTVAELKKIDLCQVLWNILPYDVQLKVDELAPTHIQVPSESRIRVEYRQGAEHPILRVRLQECFGMQQTPRVDAGKRPVLMELLSPGFKPVQLTQDLQHFWEDTYFEVRKELKRRYPKHAWPDNPLEEPALRGVKRKQ